jgi:hypothetical protein
MCGFWEIGGGGFWSADFAGLVVLLKTLHRDYAQHLLVVMI